MLAEKKYGSQYELDDDSSQELLDYLEIEDGYEDGPESKESNALQKQQEFCDVLGYQDKIIWDCYEKDEKPFLETKLKLIFLDDENSNNEKNVLKLTNKIWNQRKYAGGKLYMSHIVVLLAKYDVYKKSLRNAQYSKNFTMHHVFRIRKCCNGESTENCCMVFIDENARVYETWNDYLKNNTLPKGIMIAPNRGIYQSGQMGHVLVEFAVTPKCGITNIVTNTLDVGSTVASIGSSSVIIAGAVLTSTVAAPVLIGAAAVGTVCAGYSIVRSSLALSDRAKHEQSIGLNNAEARGSWINIAGGVTGVVACGATKGVALLARNGRIIEKAIETSVSIANITALTTQGAGIVNGVATIILKLKDNEKISGLDIFQLSASLFLFTHSVANFQTAKQIMDDNKDCTMRQFRKAFGEKQNQNFQMLAETAKNLHLNDNEIVRSLKNITNMVTNITRCPIEKIYELFFGRDGTVYSREKAEATETDTIISNDNKQYAINMKSFMNFIQHIRKKFFVESEGDVRNVFIDALVQLTFKAFNIFMDIVNDFIRKCGKKIQQQLGRIIPYELFIANAIAAVANSSSSDFNLIKFLENNVRPTIFKKIQMFFDQFRINPRDPINCKRCNGQYYNKILNE